MRIEGIDYNVNWKNFTVGSSIFIPCLNPTLAKKKIARTTKRLKIPTLTKVVIVDGIQGVRVWRIN